MGIADDKLEIMELISRYSHAFDGGDADSCAALFTDDGTLAEREGRQDMVRGRGHKELKIHLSAEIAKRGGTQPRHHVRNTIYTEANANHMVARTYYLATGVAGEGQLATVTGTGIFEDEVARTPEGWRIKRRSIIPDPRIP